MANPKPRTRVPVWFFTRLLGAIVELGTAGGVLAVLFLESVSLSRAPPPVSPISSHPLPTAQAGCGGGSSFHPAAVVALATAAALGLAVNAGLLCGVGALLSCSRKSRGSRGGAGGVSDAALAESSLRWASRCEWLAGAPVCCFNSRRRVRAVPGTADPYRLVGSVMAGVFELTASLRLTVTDLVAGL